MHCFIFCMGTDGDCFPVFTLARRLKERGHKVTVAGPPVYAGSPVLRDIGFEALCTPGEYEQFVADAGKLAGRYGLLSCRNHAVRWNLNAWRAIRDVCARDLLVLAPDQPFFWADVVAKLELECPVVRFQVDPPYPAGAAVTEAQLPFGRVQQHLTAMLALQWYAASAEAGLAGESATLGSLSVARMKIPVIALWPDWLVGSPGRNKTGGIRHFGFLLPEAGCHDALGEFPPMQGHAIFKRGRADLWSEWVYRTVFEVCRKLDVPGLLLGGRSPRMKLPAGIAWRPFVPLELALKDARLILHNGGIGTSGAAIQQGVPQIIVPQWLAQPGIAEWMRRLGVAAVIAPGRFTAPALERATQQTGQGRMRARSQELASRIDTRRDLLRICEYLEGLANG